MDMILGVFTKLGIDQTIFIQFTTIVALYFLLKVVFLNKLKEVIELREEKTVKLEDDANKRMNKAQDLANTYKVRVDKMYADAQEVFRSKKSELYQREKEKLDAYEYHVQTEYERKKDDLLKEVSTKKEQILSHVDDLSKNLVDKLLH